MSLEHLLDQTYILLRPLAHRALRIFLFHIVLCRFDGKGVSSFDHLERGLVRSMPNEGDQLRDGVSKNPHHSVLRLHFSFDSHGSIPIPL